MTQDPNAWWSKEIGRDLNKGMIQPYKGALGSFRLKSPRERRKSILALTIALAVDAAAVYFVIELFRHNAR